MQKIIQLEIEYANSTNLEGCTTNFEGGDPSNLERKLHG